MESEYDLTLNKDIWERKWFHDRKKKISFGERKRVSKAPWKIQGENTHLCRIKWLYLHDGIIICHSNFTNSYSYPGIGKETGRESQCCVVLWILYEVCFSIFKNWEIHEAQVQIFFENFQNLWTSVFMSPNQKNPWFLIFKKFQRIDGSHERTTKEPAV